MVEAASLVSQDSKAHFENISLSQRTSTQRVGLIDEDLSSQLEREVVDCMHLSLALDDRTLRILHSFSSLSSPLTRDRRGGTEGNSPAFGTD